MIFQDSIFFFLNLLLLLGGSGGVAITFFLYRKNNNPLVKIYFLALLFWTLNELVELVYFYITLILKINNDIVNLLQYDLQFVVAGILGLTFIFLVEGFIRKKFTRFERNLYFAVAVLVILPVVWLLNNFTTGIRIWEFVMPIKSILIFGLIFRLLYIFARSINLILNEDIKQLTKRLGLVSLILYPLVVLDAMQTSTSGYMFGVSMSLLFYFVFNIMWMRVSAKYITLPDIIRVSDDEPLGKYIEKFGISKREKEVIQLLLEGISYKAIADKLFISHETVKTHVNNIYKKSGVNNKVELINLIKKCVNTL